MSERPRWNFLDLVCTLAGTFFCLLLGIEDGWRAGLGVWLVALTAYWLGRTVVNEPPRQSPTDPPPSPQPPEQRNHGNDP